jgi:biopolymer transport protein ExbD
MASTSRSACGSETISEINVTPLVDIVLVLLVILMVTASYVVSKAIPVDLPSGSTGAAVPTTVAIAIDERGATLLDGKPVSPSLLRVAVRAARGQDAQTRAVIAADGSTAHRHVVRVIDLLRQEGIDRFAINVRPEDVAAGGG